MIGGFDRASDAGEDENGSEAVEDDDVDEAVAGVGADGVNLREEKEEDGEGDDDGEEDEEDGDEGRCCRMDNRLSDSGLGVNIFKKLPILPIFLFCPFF